MDVSRFSLYLERRSDMSGIGAKSEMFGGRSKHENQNLQRLSGQRQWLRANHQIESSLGRGSSPTTIKTKNL